MDTSADEFIRSKPESINFIIMEEDGTVYIDDGAVRNRKPLRVDSAMETQTLLALLPKVKSICIGDDDVRMHDPCPPAILEALAAHHEFRRWNCSSTTRSRT
jgi:hypothetical protein